MITQDEIREILDYDPKTGGFTWAKGRRGCTKGRTCGCIVKIGRVKYLEIGLNRKIYFGHRLAWMYIHGKWPEGDLDHFDGDGLNNRLSNLREATRGQNNANSRARANITGFRGVHKQTQGNTWYAKISYKGVTRYLGSFDTPESASTAYETAAKRVFGEFYRAK